MKGTFQMKIKDWPLPPFLFHFQQHHPINWEKIFNRCAPIDVEIGFGTGEMLMQLAESYPDRNIIGIEKNIERICKTLLAIDNKKRQNKNSQMGNIRIIEIDATLAFQKLFNQQCIDNIYSLFPCPWPKTAHAKHRLFSNAFLKLINNRLKPQGRLKIITDFLPYQKWIIEQAKGCGFSINNRITHAGYNTKFEQKWRQAGQKEFFETELTKKRHIILAGQEKIMLRVYQIKQFKAENFHLYDKTGKISVIFKEIIFDKKRQKAVVRTIVAEDNATQHFWIAIEKKTKYWHIYKAEGQNIFPTPGIALALEMVYKAAKQSY